MAYLADYRVSVYEERGSHLVSNIWYTSRNAARRAFDTAARSWIDNRLACVLLTHGTRVLASKSTYDNNVVYDRAFYSPRQD